ncbi:hypothetical protein NLJ89_g11552 [Agrocybe chaxingu]|uniref:Uncharacterized protein n=1 Tax=Agrocybe chaxingu TaxID=84603 RepID=A0A9W8JNI7_9AGAR|nr:hypothetical protein NLJ89_g11552 [Agrocybe chaxingu]
MTTIIYANPAFYVFLATFTAFMLLRFVWQAADNAVDPTCVKLLLPVHFTGKWGTVWDVGMVLGLGWDLLFAPLGYTWEPEIAIPITKALIFYPISVVFTFFTMASLMPVLCARNARSDKIFDIFAWMSFGTSALAFFFMIGMFDTARKRFERRGFDASFGNLVSFIVM